MGIPEIRTDLEKEWAVFLEDRPGNRNNWTQDQRWRADNPGEYGLLLGYRAGGARPTLTTEPGRRMVENIAAWLKTAPAPPTGTLRWKPPGYPNYSGYTTIALTTGAQTLNLDNSKDYILDLSTKAWSSGSSRTIGLGINGGRNVVCIGGAALFNATNNQDDNLGVLLDVGPDGGTIHLEGLDILACNGITVRTRRRVQIENCRINVYAWNDDYNGGAGVHPDLVQTWGTSGAQFPCAGIYMHKVTMFTPYQGMSNLMEANPALMGRTDPFVWERWEVDVHPRKNLNGSFDAGSYFFHSDSPTGDNNGPYTEFIGEVYSELPTFNNGAGVRGIDDIAVNRSMNGPKYFPYEIRSPSGAELYRSPDPPTGGSGRPEAKQVGNYLTFSRVPALSKQKLFVGKPPGGEFCPAGVPGPNYVSPGYL